MRSMTGHGRGVNEIGGRRVTAEVRAVNHRYLDVKLRIPYTDPVIEEKVTAVVRRALERGSIALSLREDGAYAAPVVRINLALATETKRTLEQARDALGLADPVPLALVVAQPGILAIGDAVGDTESILAAALPAVEVALATLVEMRRREGRSLEADLGARLGRLEEFAATIEAAGPRVVEEHRRKLLERVERLIGGVVAPDAVRLATEVALLADRMDVTEETVRLRSHLQQARELMVKDAPVGRRLDFLVQEIGREVNTIGSKSQAAELASLVVEAKAELEKIREQVQNVE